MNMNDMMGLLQQMKRRMLPDPGTDPGKGPGSMQVPWHLGGSTRNKDAPTSSSGQDAQGMTDADRARYGPYLDDMQTLQQMIARLRQQMNQPGISMEDQRALFQQIQELEAQVQQLSQQAENSRRMQLQGDGSVLRMGTSSSGGNYGGESAAERRLRRQRELAAGRPWVITGSGGGGSAGGGNPFGWMGGGFSSPDTPGIRRGGG